MKYSNVHGQLWLGTPLPNQAMSSELQFSEQWLFRPSFIFNSLMPSLLCFAPTYGSGFESLCHWLDGLEPGSGSRWRAQLGEELCGQSHHRGHKERRVLQAAHILQHGPLQVAEILRPSPTVPLHCTPLIYPCFVPPYWTYLIQQDKCQWLIDDWSGATCAGRDGVQVRVTVSNGQALVWV